MYVFLLIRVEFFDTSSNSIYISLQGSTARICGAYFKLQYKGTLIRRVNSTVFVELANTLDQIFMNIKDFL